MGFGIFELKEEVADREHWRIKTGGKTCGSEDRRKKSKNVF